MDTDNCLLSLLPPELKGVVTGYTDVLDALLLPSVTEEEALWVIRKEERISITSLVEGFRCTTREYIDMGQDCLMESVYEVFYTAAIGVCRMGEKDTMAHFVSDVTDDIVIRDISLLSSALLQEQESGYRSLLDVRSTLLVIDRRFSALVDRDISVEIARQKTFELLRGTISLCSRTEGFSENYIESSERALSSVSQNKHCLTMRC